MMNAIAKLSRDFVIGMTCAAAPFCISGCAATPREVMHAWVTSLEWFHPEYEGTANRVNDLEQAWQQEQSAKGVEGFQGVGTIRGSADR